MKKQVLDVKGILLITVLLVCGMMIGSLYDYQISCTVLNTNSLFGQILAAFGQLPVTVGHVIVGFILFYTTQKKWKLSTVLSYLAGIYCYLMALVMAIMDPVMYLGISPLAASGLAISEVLLVSYCTYRWSIKISKENLQKFAGFLAFVMMGQLILINLIKPLASRPRMRIIAITPEASFQPWWIFGSGLKETLMSSLQIASEEFKSFPSGHSGCAAVAMSYCVIPMIQGKNTVKRWLLVGIGFSLIVMFSRIIMGAHFLTDVLFGFGITFFVFILAIRLFYGGKKHAKTSD